jgi:hypothetical protein
MVKLTVADPVAAVVPPDAIVAVVPPTVTVRAELAAKPWAVILTPAVPTGPLVTVRLMAEAEMVKLFAEVALSPEASVTNTVWAPWGAAGMVKVTVETPLLAVVPPAVMVASVPFTFTVRDELAAKPWARMVTPVVPTGPLLGLRPVADAATVKLVAEVAVLAEASVTTTVWAPWVSVGMVKVTVDVPLAAVVPPAVMVAAVPPTVTLKAELEANPWARIEAEEPTVPVAGLRPVADGVTVKLVAEVAVLAAASVTTTL